MNIRRNARRGSPCARACNILLFCILVLPSVANATPAATLKGALILKFLEHFEWRNESRINTFVIGFYGPDRDIYQALQPGTHRAKGKPVRVAIYENLEQARAAHILVLSPSLNDESDRVAYALSGSNTLLVSQDNPDANSIMIDIGMMNRKLTFEANTPNIINEGLKYSKNIVLIGGTELDVAKLFELRENKLRTTRSELAGLSSKLRIQSEQLEERRKAFAAQQEAFKALEASTSKIRSMLESSKSALQRSQEALQRNEQNLQEREQELARKEAEVAALVAEIAENEKILAEQLRHIDTQKSVITQQGEEITTHKSEIQQKELKLGENEIVITEAKSTIERQQFFVALAVTGTFFLLVLLFTIQRSLSTIKRKNHQLATLNEELASVNQRLASANHELNALNEAKSNMLSVLSHDIRTPMNAIMGMSEMLSSENLSARQRTFNQNVLNAGHSLLDLINNILDMSKIEAGKMSLEFLRMDLYQVISDLNDLFLFQALNAEIEWLCRVDMDVPQFIYCDPTRLRQILVNYLGNAFKFTGPGGRIDLTVNLHPENADLLYFRVTDTGIGIPETSLSNVFESFTQADASTSRKYGGTGLGLSICKELSELMGGEVGVESTPGEGSTFWCTIALKADEQSAPPHALNASALQGVRLLIAEDNAMQAEFVQEQASRFGMQASAARNGQQAVAMAREAQERSEPYELFCFDLNMPELDGVEAIRQIREMEAYKDTPAALVSATDDFQFDEPLAAKGFNLAQRKPVVSYGYLALFVRLLGTENNGSKENVTGRWSDAALSALEGRRLNVLIAEDNVVNCTLMKAMLEKLSCHCHLAHTGMEALELMQSGRVHFDIVFMDCEMPEMDGWHATREIRAWEERQALPACPIIALTGHTDEGATKRCVKAGMNAVLNKPVKLSSLQDALLEQLKTA